MQDMEHILKILTLAEKSGRIGIVLGPEASDAELLAAHALKDRLGEKALILNAPDSLQDRWSHLFKKERVQKETALALDVERHPVDELRYEKDGGKLRIFLSSQNPLTKDLFELEERFPPSDMIIALGFFHQEDLTRFLKTDAPVKNDDAVISLSSHSSALPPSNTPLESPLLITRWDVDAMKLWSRALLRSYMEDGNGVFWAFLPKEDFQKTNQKETILPSLVVGMQGSMNLPPLMVVLWQSQDTSDANVHILFTSTDPAIMEKLSHSTQTPIANTVLITGSFSNFSTAEVEARKLIKSL